ncbi:phosphocholine cytidylyltransferase family protein [Roseovarius sp. S1116L3]|uniref:phosphocholine cytidylyltransferase family protein n=1 Tax=Roseovarius roseus TaxID=3342636 RepID=UPI003726B67B
MKAIILAAGRGSRMKSMTDDNPKCMVKLHGEPLIEHQLRSLRQAGITEVAVVTGYLSNMLQGYGDHKFHNPRWADTNMVSSLATASEWLNAEPCIVSYSDICYDASAVTSLMDSDADLAITYDPDWERQWTARFGDPLLDAETFKLGAGGELTEIGGKPDTISEIEGQYMGLLRFTPPAWTDLESMRHALSDARRDALDMTSALQNIIDRRNIRVMPIAYRGAWGEIDSSEDISVFE